MKGRSSTTGLYISRADSCQSVKIWRAGIPVDRALERRLRSHAPCREEQTDDGIIAEASANVCEERLAVAIREVIRIAGQLAEIGHAIVDRGVANPHCRQRVDASFGEVLRHAFNEPQRHRFEVESPAVVRHRRGDVELEHVHQLMAQDVIVFGVVAGERQDHAIHERIGEAAGALSDQLRRGGGLLKVRRVRVEHDRLAREGVIEHARQACVPALRLTADVIDHVRFAVVVVDVEVLRLQDLEVEVLPLHFVSAEVLGVCGGCENNEEGKEDYDRFTHRDSPRGIFRRLQAGSGCKFAALRMLLLFSLVR